MSSFKHKDRCYSILNILLVLNLSTDMYKQQRVVFNPSPRGGVATTPLTVLALVLKIAQPRGKIGPGTFKFILSLHFSEKISNLPPTPGVG